MAVSENDLELLEAYLDDALSMGEADQLRARLANDAELAGALERVRAERATRRTFFASLEPDDSTIAKLTAQVRASMARRRYFSRVLRLGRYITAAAACVVAGFLARGWFDHPNPNQTANGNPNNTKIEKIEIYQVTLRDDAGHVVGVQKFNSLEKAQEFAADLARWQSHSERLASGRFVVHSDRF
jgi:anti-sigma factor RsiW